MPLAVTPARLLDVLFFHNEGCGVCFDWVFFFSGEEEVRHVSWLCVFFFLKTLWL